MNAAVSALDLGRSLRARALATIDDIVLDLAFEPMTGDGATALLLSLYGHPAAGTVLNASLAIMGSAPMNVSLFGGISWLAWVVDELVGGRDADSVLARFDIALLQAFDDRVGFDLVGGLAGIGVMAASREQAGGAKIADRVLRKLEVAAVPFGDGVAWPTPVAHMSPSQRETYPDGMFDLGVAHGMGGVIGMLSQFVEAEIEVGRSRALLQRAVAWLRDAATPGCPRFGTNWPVDRGGPRIGWCYGDLGIAGVLLRASAALDDEALADEAVGLLRGVIAPLEERGAPDASFCHGAAGFAHIYSVAYQQTGLEDMRVQAVRWLREVIEMRKPGTGIAGYSSLKIDGDATRWEADRSLLTGVVGTALVLHAATTDDVPSWQRLFAL